MSETEYFMMFAFLAAVSLTLWKLYIILPHQPLEDDDRTPEAVAQLERLLLDAIASARAQGEEPTPAILLEQMRRDTRFDAQRFWRLNENRINMLLSQLYVETGATSPAELLRIKRG